MRHPSIRKSSPTGGGPWIGIVRLRTKGHGDCFLLFVERSALAWALLHTPTFWFVSCAGSALNTPGFKIRSLPRNASTRRYIDNWRIPSSGMFRHVCLLRTDVSELRIVSILSVAKKSVSSSLSGSRFSSALRKETTHSSDPFLTRPTRPNIPENNILHSRRCENFKSPIVLTAWAL
jgi:hypothetical protein